MRSILLFLFILLFSSYKEEPLCPEGRLKDEATFAVGTALDTEKLKYEEKYWTIALAQFNSFTPERILKPDYIHPRKDVYNFTEIDHLMDFCKENRIRLHGHTLVWHKSLPLWMERFESDQAGWDQMLKEHIQTVVKHCGRYVKSWDVVNEAFNDDGSFRRNIWYEHLGEGYIEKAFRYAHEADTACQLFYNDYSIEKYSGKLAAVIEHFRMLKDKGVRVDGIGMQMHVSLEYPSSDEISDAAKRIEKAGFKVHYSELDVRVNEQHLFISKKKLLALQKQRMKEIVEGYRKLEPSSQFGITLWGVSDNDSWLTEQRIRSRPLLYNSRYRIKPAYCGFMEGLRH